MTLTALNNRTTVVTPNVKLSGVANREDRTIDLYYDLAKGSTTSVDLTFTVKDNEVDATNEYSIGQSLSLSVDGKAHASISIPFGAEQIFVVATPVGDDVTTPAVLKIGLASGN